MNPSINSNTNSNTDPNYNLGSHEATDATYCNTLKQFHHVATRCQTLQHVATRCNTLQYSATAATLEELQHIEDMASSQAIASFSTSFVALIETGETLQQLQHIATRCSSSITFATHCNSSNTLQHVATHCLTSSNRLLVCLIETGKTTQRAACLPLQPLMTFLKS